MSVTMGKESFLDMLKKLSVSKTVSSPEIQVVAMNFYDDGMKSAMYTDDEVLSVYYHAKKNKFNLYRPEAEAVAFNVPDVYKVIKELFTTHVSMKIDNERNIIIFEDIEKRRIETQIIDISSVKLVDESEIEVTDKYVVPKDRRVIYYLRIPYDKLKPLTKLLTKKSDDTAIRFNFKGNLIYLEYTKGLVNVKDRMLAEVYLQEEDEYSVAYPGDVIKNVLSVLSGDIIVTVTEDGIMSMGKKTDTEDVFYIFAPVEE